MRILHVTDNALPHLGGIEIFVDDLARQQAAVGHEVAVLTATSGADEEGSPVRMIRPGGSLPAVPLVRYVPSRSVVRRGEWDVVHVHLSVVSAFATLIARDASRAGLPVVVTVHSLWRGRLAGVRAVGDIVGWDRWPVLWTAVSTAAAMDMQRVLRPATWVSIVPNAVDVAWWRADIQPPAVRRPGEPVRLLSVMRMAPRKRPLHLVKALRQVRAAVPDDQPIEAVLVGDGPLLGRLEAELRRHGMEDWVHLPGRLSRTEIRDLCRSSDLYVAPAHRESFGIAALEARAAGLPVVAMRSGGVGEFIEEGVEGTLCRDDAAMRRALTDLVVDHERRREMAAHNAAVAPSLDWETVLERVDRAYARAASYAVPRLSVSEARSAVDQDSSYVRR